MRNGRGACPDEYREALMGPLSYFIALASKLLNPPLEGYFVYEMGETCPEVGREPVPMNIGKPW